ncbi:MAG: twin-arginine translocase TatA/TatE family subunit [Anaerolineales bacterium]|jgi:sec-independent protein translocase protein TatA
MGPIRIGVPELLIILVIVILIFGVGRVAGIGRELGSAIRGFREGLKGDEEESAEKTDAEEEKKD